MNTADTLPQLDIAPQPVPLTRLPDGTLRVTGTRISLDCVIESYKYGATAEAIVRSFDSLRLADVYALFSYYLNHTEQVDFFLKAREAEAVQLQCEIEAGQPRRAKFREELLARYARMVAEERVKWPGRFPPADENA